MVRIKINLEIVKDLYFIQKKPIKVIADILNISSDTLYYRMKIAGIKLRNYSECQSGPLNHQYGKPLSNETKEKIKQNLLGEKNPFYGKHHSEETKAKLRNKDLSGNKNPFFNKHHSIETKLKISLANGGNGIYLLPNKYYPEFNQKLRKIIKNLYGNKCSGKNCLMTEENHIKIYKRSLECHHIDYDKKNNNVFNLIPLCKPCNIKANKNKAFWIEYYLSKVNSLKIDLLLIIHKNRIGDYQKELNILKEYFIYAH
jgi:hypothetical protein